MLEATIVHLQDHPAAAAPPNRRGHQVPPLLPPTAPGQTTASSPSFRPETKTPRRDSYPPDINITSPDKTS